MFGIQDFDTFEVCAVVKKTSDTGLTSNERLLVIRAGMLYYYSKVPSNFTNDVKLLHTIKDLPKCSIFTPHLRIIKVDPKVSQDLTITFNTKDLKQKDQIMFRASTVEEPFSSKEKDKGKDTEWKVKFNSAQRCKQWSRYLEQLKEHYTKIDEKERQQMEMYERFFEEFNPDKKKLNQMRRSAVYSPTQPKQPVASFRATNLNFTATNQLLTGIKEVDDDKVSETESARMNDLRRKVSKKQEQLKNPDQTNFENLLVDSQNLGEVQKQTKPKEAETQMEALKQLEEGMRQREILKHQERERTMKEGQHINQRHHQQQQVKQKCVQQHVLETINQPSEKQVVDEEAEKEKQRELEKEWERERVKMIQFARTRQRQRQERQRREQEQEERRLLQKAPQEQEPEQQFDHEETPPDGELPRETTKPPYQQIQNMLASQSAAQSDQQGKSGPLRGRQQPPQNIQCVTSTQPFQIAKAVKRIPSLRRKDSTQEAVPTHYLSYIDYQGLVFQSGFEQRLSRQIEFLRYIAKLREEVRSEFEQIVDEFNHPADKRIRKVTGKVYTNDRMTIQLAFCETKIIALYSGQRTLHNQSAFQTLVDKFNMYNNLQTNILKTLKKRQQFYLRVPYCMLIEYKGVMGLATINDYLIDSHLQQLEGAPRHILAETALVISEHLTQNYRLSKIFDSSLYLITVEATHKADQSSEQRVCLNLSKPLDKTRRNMYPSEEQVKILLEDKSKVAPEQFQNLSLLLFVYHVRSLYRSGQGELDSKDFFSLLLSLNPEVTKLLQPSCASKYPLKGLMIEYLRELCGVSIDLNELTCRQDLLSGSIRQVTQTSLCRIYAYPNLEVFGLIDGFQEFSNKQFGGKALKLWKIWSQGDPSLQQVYSFFRVISHFKNRNTAQGLEESDAFTNAVRYTHPLKLRLYETVLNHHYSEGDQAGFIKCFRQTLNYIEFTFGRHSSLTTLYCVLGQFLNKQGKSEEALNLYNTVISKAVDPRVQTEMEIDMSSIYLNLTNKDTVEEIIAFSLSLLDKRKGVAQVKVRQFLAHLYLISGRQEQAKLYIQGAIQQYQAEDNVRQLVQCCVLGSKIWGNTFSKQKELTDKMFQICKQNTDYLDKLSRMFQNVLMKLSSKSGTVLEHRKAQKTKEELFWRISERSGGQAVNYLHSIFNQIVDHKESEQISDMLQFALN